MTKKRLRWGLLSTARINERLIPCLKKSNDNELLAIASRSRNVADHYAESHGISRAYASYESMLEDPDIDVVYLSLPNSLHKEWVIKCVEVGKHVLCEKPLAISPEEVSEIAEAGYEFSELGPYGYLPTDPKEILDLMEVLKLKIIGSFVFDNLHIESEHKRIKNIISNSCSLLQKINSEVFVIIDHITKERMETSGNQAMSPNLDINDHKKMVNFINEIADMCFEKFGLL